MDHNQAIWAAAKTTAFEPDASGAVPITGTPVESYLFLAIRLQGESPCHYTLNLGQLPPRFYVDSRSLMRFQFAFPLFAAPMEQFFSTTALRPATATGWHGITILRADTNAPVAADSLSATLWVLNGAFEGNEFRLESLKALQEIPNAWAGKRLVLVSRGNFIVTSGQDVKVSRISSAQLGNWHVCEISPLHAGETIRLQGSPPEEIFAAVSVFPEWMSLQKYRNSHSF